MAFISLLTLDLHLPANADLKGKRKEVKSLTEHLRGRFGAAVAETDHHDLWQRATLTVALVGREHGPLEETVDALQRHVESRFGDLVSWQRQVFSTTDLSEH